MKKEAKKKITPTMHPNTQKVIDIVMNWFVATLVIMAIAYVLPGVTVSGFFVALVAAIVLGLINAVIKPIVIFLTLPITIVTLGLFTFVIDALMIMLAAFFISGFSVRNFWWALLFSFLLSLVNSLLFNRMPRYRYQND